ncbi:MAG: DUF3592 domain-containing protein [Saprospiraceae bacterium]
MNIIALLLAAVFALLGTYFAFFGIKHCFQYARMLRAGWHAEGRVTGIKTAQRWRKGRSWLEYSAIIAFETAWNEQREVEYANPTGSDAFKAGDKLTVWYDQNDPEVFSLGGWHFVQDTATHFIFAVFLGVPGWGILVQLFKPYIHF